MTEQQAVMDKDEHLQIQIPSETKFDLGLKALHAHEPLRMIVLRALDAYGVIVPPDAIRDRRKR
ncbi:MAG: hypothetical protein E2598_08145 [Sphingobium sp.]|nr:hypothetical protein [Sphingobium sp.]